MTKKDYELIASAIKYTATISPDSTAVYAVADELSYRFAKENTRFDRDKFLAACGIETAWDKAKTYNQKLDAFAAEVKSDQVHEWISPSRCVMCNHWHAEAGNICAECSGKIPY